MLAQARGRAGLCRSAVAHRWRCRTFEPQRLTIGSLGPAAPLLTAACLQAFAAKPAARRVAVPRRVLAQAATTVSKRSCCPAASFCSSAWLGLLCRYCRILPQLQSECIAGQASARPPVRPPATLRQAGSRQRAPARSGACMAQAGRQAAGGVAGWLLLKSAALCLSGALIALGWLERLATTASQPASCGGPAGRRIRSLQASKPAVPVA